MKPWLKTGLCIGFWSFTTWADVPKEEVEAYHELLKQSSDPYMLEILGEGAKRNLPLPKDMSALWKEAKYRKILLQSMSVEQMKQQGVLSAKGCLALSMEEQSALWLRAANDEVLGSSEEILNLGKAVYADASSWVQDLILSLHKKVGSKELLTVLSPEKRDTERGYELQFLDTPQPSDLNYEKGDSDMMVRAKVKRMTELAADQQKKILATYKNAPVMVQVQLVPFYGEEALTATLKNSKNDEMRAAALKTLLNKKWVEGQVMRVLKSKSYAEGHEVYQYLVRNPDRITEKSFAKYWSASSDVGKRVLSAFLWQHPKAEVSKTLRDHVDSKEDKMIGMQGLHALSAHGQSDWLMAHLKAKKWNSELLAICLDTLWKWKEVKEGDKFYLDIFLAQGYKNGGPGMESLLKLMGLSKHRLAVKPIASFFREVEEPVVEVDVAIEASGWHGSKDFLRSLKGFERDGNKDPILLWAIQKCEGKEAAFPEPEDVGFRLNPYFFHSLDARD